VTNVNFMEAISSGFGNYVNFSGRTPRAAYWYWTLFAILVCGAAAMIDAVVEANFFYAVAVLALALPGIGVAIRRLHDIDRSGWWLLLNLTILGAFVVLYWACDKGTAGSNRFGPDPLAAT
jgi:uncharacterized membrane protein YhaH (DUF805 family)